MTENNQPLLKVGDVVWVLKDLTPRGIWPIGRVVETSPGQDCEVRVAKVKTAYGSFVRPVASLARVFLRRFLTQIFAPVLGNMSYIHPL